MLFAQSSNPATDVAAAATVSVSRVTSSLGETVTALWEKSLECIPSLIACIVILIAGWLIARLLRWIARTAFGKIQMDAACEKIGLHDVTRSVGIRAPSSVILSQFAFWCVMLLFLIAGVDALGMESISRAIESLAAYLPNVIGALVILVFGLVVANFVRDVVQGAAERFGIEYAGPVGQVVFGLIVLVVGSLAVGQLNLNTALVDRVIEIFLMATGAALAIAIGLGSRDMARQVVAGVYARDVFEEGSKVRVGEHSGTVEVVRAVNTAIRTSDGKTVVIPNAQLMEMEVEQSD